PAARGDPADPGSSPEVVLMRRILVVAALALAALVAVVAYTWNGRGGTSSDGAHAPAQRGQARGPMPGRPGERPPMPVEIASARRETVVEQITVVGNLIGEATVEVVPKVSGRLQAVHVRLGDRVAQGQPIAKIEDKELREQVRQAEASFEVARATVRQREADLKYAETSLERARNLFGRQLLPRQSLDDAEARYQAAVAQLDLAQAQFQQAQARLEELRINLGNTLIVSPVDGFVAKRYLDPGAFASPSAPVVAVVAIGRLRLVANLVERDVRRVRAGIPATVEVDAYPGEQFSARVARVAPVFDPATRTAEMEIEVPNPGFRLKPGMYARVRLTVGTRTNALVVPRNAVVDVEGRRGVFLASGNRAEFRPVETGLQDDVKVEVVKGLRDGARVVTTGALALRDGDVIVPAGRRAERPGPSATRGNGTADRPGAR
ncbi:MAG TPA: efflux RND transporter periplasmic adaptor subunit, partial [Vicinamibacterales bacterium]|nr:efflux RND transporter periplasmic adaptor subunit [Vicinamibacterales bacterium]